MLSERMQATLNQQINEEFGSFYNYLAISAYFTEMNLPGMAHWMRLQALEEQVHAMKFYHYILERNGHVRLAALGAPPERWNSPLAAFEDGYRHEQKITGLINNLVNLAIEEKDHATNAFLQWFVNEQVEEETSALAVIQSLRMIGDNPAGLFMLDRELGQRQPEADADEEEGE